MRTYIKCYAVQSGDCESVGARSAVPDCVLIAWGFAGLWKGKVHLNCDVHLTVEIAYDGFDII
jgi:hypothetical protein